MNVKTKKSRTYLFIVFVCGLYVATPRENVNAAVVVDNFANTAAGFVGNIGSGSDTSFSSAFSVGAVPHTLDSISVRLQYSSGPGTVQVAMNLLQDNGSNAPGALIGTFANQSIPETATAMAEYSFTPSGTAPTLAANTTYWVELQRVLPGIETKIGLEQATPVAGPLGSFPELGISLNGGAPSDFSFPGLDLYMRVQGTSAVPEPSSFLFLGLVACGGMAYRRKRILSFFIQ